MTERGCRNSAAAPVFSFCHFVFQAFSLRLLSTAMRLSWRLSLKKSFTEQPARPEDAQAQAQAQEDAHAQCDAQAQDDAQEE